jgi:cation transport ATPase
MSKHDVSAAVVPLLSSSIAIAYGGSGLAFSLIASWPLLAGFQLSLALIAWALDALLGAVLLWAGFATLMKSNRGRVVMLCALAASALYEFVRTSAFFPSIASRPRDQSQDIFVLAILLVAILLALAPSSVRYTTNATSQRE